MYLGLIGFGLIVALTAILVGLVIQALFLLNLMRLLETVRPQNRAMSPGLVWLNLIPVFELGWMIYTVLMIKESVGRENASRWGASLNERNTHTIGLVYAILGAAGFVLSFGGYANRGFSAFVGLATLAGFVLWIIYWVRTNRMRRDLEATAVRGYGPAGPGNGASYGPAPTSWQPPPLTPSAGGEPLTPASRSGSAAFCSQCGNQLHPDQRFCGACGAPVPAK